ncbi:MAG: EAL domain-containing protein [Syntrophales bacterium]|nr:EAL domain-containing protein [Syntrophales bacterium]
MKDLSGTNQKLIKEISILKQRIQELEQLESERKRVEEALWKSEEKFRTIFDRASDGILIADAITKKFLQGNSAICSRLGYTKEEIESLTINDIHPPKDISHILDEFERLAKGEKVLAEDLPVLRKDGSIVYADISASPAIIGGVHCLIGIFRDITERKRAESEIQALARFPSENPNPVLRIARDGTLLYANEVGSSQLPDWHLQAGRGVPSMVRDVASQALTSGKTRLLDLEHRGQVYSFFVVPIADADYANMYGSDITARKRAEEELRLSEERFSRIFDEGPVGMVLVNLNREIVTANEALCLLLGYSVQELAGQRMADITYEKDKEKSTNFSSLLAADKAAHPPFEKRYVRKDGGIVWAKVTASAIHSKEGRVIYTLGIIEDLTESKKAAEKIHLLAYYDSLTGLPNRTFHKELTKRAIEHANRHKEIFAFIYIGLDNFQRINDTFGHSMGDLLLKAAADRLTNSLRKSDYVASSYEAETTEVVSRVGGDEFIVLAQDLTQAQDAAKTAHRLLREISAPYDLSGREVFMTASIGIALYPDDGTDVDDLLKNADTAMRHTKNEGKNHYQFYSGSMNSAVLELLALENDLRKALARNELVLYYQPKVDAATRMVKGMEALIRWMHPDKGLISPMQFIPLAEANGLIIPIGEFVIRTVCGQIKTWQEAGYKQVNIALNVSSRQFDQQNFTEVIRGILLDTMISPQCLELEITESIIMRNPEKAIRALAELKEMGVQIAIDDFGTGYSSLSYLKRLPLDFLKIDISFVKNLVSDPSDQAIVRATIAMAHGLNLKTIAEGVETEEQLSFLQEHGCDEIQGYLFSRPLPAEEIPGILAKGYL